MKAIVDETKPRRTSVTRVRVILTPSATRLAFASLVALALIFICFVASAIADDAGGNSGQIPVEAIEQALQSEQPDTHLTDPQAAEELPHVNLGRAEALELLLAVFSAQLQAPAGVYDELHVSKFLSANAGIIAGDQRPQGTEAEDGEDADAYDGPVLFESSIPIRVEDSSEGVSVLDLGLERADNGLESSSPLVPVTVPGELSEGIEVPSAGVAISLAEAPEREPSIVEQSVAVYPNVAPDTDLAVATTPYGFETLTQLRSAAAPSTQTFDLAIPDGATLDETEGGGAQVTKDGEQLLEISAPTAIDASGEGVPVHLSVEGSALTLAAETSPSTSYPLLIDPMYDKYSWGYNDPSTKGLENWTSSSNASAFVASNSVICGTGSNKCDDPNMKPGIPGLFAKVDSSTTMAAGNQASWNYYVPRYASDYSKYGVRPQSFIDKMDLSRVVFRKAAGEPGSKALASPSFVAGIWDDVKNAWASSGSVYAHTSNEGSLNEYSTIYKIPGNSNQNAKKAIGLSLVSNEAGTTTARREAYVGAVDIELGDTGAPSFGSFTAPSQWLDQAASPIVFKASDAGLGVYNIRLAETDVQGSEWKAGWKKWITAQGCVGTVSSPCPREWSSTDPGSPQLEYKPAEMTQGIHKMAATAVDPFAPTEEKANRSTPYKFDLKIDHTNPGLSLAGTLTEQSKLGTTRPRYFLKTEATDATEASPQAGIASQVVKIDGTTVDTTSPGCATQSCPLSRTVQVDNLSYGVGKHTVVVTATDGVGRQVTKETTFEVQRDTINPAVFVGGSLVEGPSGWVGQGVYTVNAIGEDPAGFGATSLELQIDGKAAGSAQTQTCPEGGCYFPATFVANLAGYQGGAHAVKVIVKDGAGNSGSTEKTIYVNPSGNISASSATATLKAVDATSPSTVVASTSEAISLSEREDGNNPGLNSSGEDLISTGTPATSEIAVQPADGFTMQAPEEAFHVEPASVGGAATSASVAAGVAAVSANTTTGVDTVLRPLYNGVEAFQDIRDASAPESYSWIVELNSGQYLSSVDDQNVGVFNKDGSEAMLIGAEAAHDATGKGVPTALSVSESGVIELSVPHREKGFVYPIIAGPSFEVGTKEVIIFKPPPPPTEEVGEVVEIEESAPLVEPSIPDPEPEAGISTRKTRHKDSEMTKCQTEACFLGFWEVHFKERFLFNGIKHVPGGQAWHDNGERTYRICNNNSSTEPYSIADNECYWIGNHAPYGYGHYMCAQEVWHINNHLTSEYHAMTFHNYGDGYVGKKQNSSCTP